MADTKNTGDKTLSVSSKTLSLKPRSETGVVRQSFSHGRTKQVVVEKKPKRRLPEKVRRFMRRARPKRRLPPPRAPRPRRPPRRSRRAAPSCCGR